VHEKTVKTTRAFTGRLLKLDVLEVELGSGQHATREVVRHPGGVVILPQLPDGRFVFVRQFRKPLETELLEAVAGTLHPGENPDLCAARELTEETGYAAERLVKLGVFATAPGYTEERLHAYYALLAPRQGALAPDEDEKIEIVYLAPPTVEELMVNGKICDAKTLAVWFLWKIRDDDRSPPTDHRQPITDNRSPITHNRPHAKAGGPR
jgi:ADP-ribose pyrophosphatase